MLIRRRVFPYPLDEFGLRVLGNDGFDVEGRFKIEEGFPSAGSGVRDENQVQKNPYMQE
jgi:hypothetical protein